MVKLTEVPLAQIARWRAPPMFDFVEDAICSGKGYRWGEQGYVLVAGSNTVLPGFVVEIACERRPWLDTKKLIAALCEISCGAIWFDALDHDAFDLVRRSGRQAQPSALLFASDHATLPSRIGKGLTVRPCGPEDEAMAVALLSSPSAELGGLTYEMAIALINQGEVYCGFRAEKLMAVGIVRSQGSDWAVIGLVVTTADGHRARLGVRFTNALVHCLNGEGRSVCGGVGVANPFAYKAAIGLGLLPFRQSWTALLADAL